MKRPYLIAILMFGYSDVGWTVLYGLIGIAYYYCTVGFLSTAPLINFSDNFGLRISNRCAKTRELILYQAQKWFSFHTFFSFISHKAPLKGNFNHKKEK